GAARGGLVVVVAAQQQDAGDDRDDHDDRDHRAVPAQSAATWCCGSLLVGARLHGPPRYVLPARCWALLRLLFCCCLLVGWIRWAWALVWRGCCARWPPSRRPGRR